MLRETASDELRRRPGRRPERIDTVQGVTIGEARAALNGGADVVGTLRRVWHLLDGGDRHAMSRDKLERAEGVTWRDPFARFRIERHGDPYGQMQMWRVDLTRGRAEMVHERPLRVDAVPQPWDEGSLLAAELAAAVRAGTDDHRLRWHSKQRREVRVDYGRALGVSRASEADATRLRDALDAQLRGEWVRDAGWWVRKND
jgi:hypothetical protein